MSSADPRTWFKLADENGFAVPAFNYSDVWDFIAIVRAAEELEAPVMVASNQLVVQDIGAEVCGAFGKAFMDRANVPVFHHLDHTLTTDLVKQCVDSGYPSVMLDASMKPLDDNIRMVKEVVDYAHPKGVCVEAEVGRIQGGGIEGDFEGGEFLTRVEDAVRIVEETGVDSLAVGIGTAHGFYEGEPKIHFDTLEAIHKAVDVPLVLHGGTGIPEADVRRAIENGICKVNVGTIIHCTYMNTLRAELMERGENVYTLEVMKDVLPKITEVVKGWIRVLRADGKAKLL